MSMARRFFLGGILAVSATWTAQSSPTSSTAPATAEPVLQDGYLRVNFEQLASYTFTPPQYDPAATGVPAQTGEEQIPTAVKELSGKKAVIVGYMVPVKMDQGLVTEFLLMRNTLACCFGGVPNMNEWVVVKMRRGVQPVMDTPVAFYGDFRVGAIFENGYITGLYRLDGEKMTTVTATATK